MTYNVKFLAHTVWFLSCNFCNF